MNEVQEVIPDHVVDVELFLFIKRCGCEVELAGKIGVSDSALRKWVNGTRKTPKTIKKIMKMSAEIESLRTERGKLKRENERLKNKIKRGKNE